jgi:hypothetical protein
MRNQKIAHAKRRRSLSLITEPQQASAAGFGMACRCGDGESINQRVSRVNSQYRASYFNVIGRFGSLRGQEIQWRRRGHLRSTTVESAIFRYRQELLCHRKVRFGDLWIKQRTAVGGCAT